MTRYTANHVLGSQRNGVNLVSMNIGHIDNATLPVQGSNYPVYSNGLLDWYRDKKMKSVRLMFTWEAVQSTLGGPVPPIEPGYADYWSDLTSVVNRLLLRDIYVILCPWQYNRNTGDTDIVYKDAAFSAANFADFWGNFATAINGVTANDQRVAFDLINEPHTPRSNGPNDFGITLTDWFDVYAPAAVNAIRLKHQNTIFIPGMNYADASFFVSNGSATAWHARFRTSQNVAVTAHIYTGIGSSSPTVLSDSCMALVNWARGNGIKVNIGEIAIDAGPNGRAMFCNTPAVAQTQWDAWQKFCLENSDVIVGWNWWGNSAAGWWNQGDSCDGDPKGRRHWGLTLDDGSSQTIYMDLIESTIPVPSLYIRDHPLDNGSEPDGSAPGGRGWESLALEVQQPDGVAGPIHGGDPSVVYVTVTNKGAAPYPGNVNDVVRLYWAKAETGLSWPSPWDGSGPSPKRGGKVDSAKPIPGAILPGNSIQIRFSWADTPKAEDFGTDDHFCLLAFVTKATAPEWEEANADRDLNRAVLSYSHIAWKNIHIVPAAKAKMGHILVTNRTDVVMRAQLAFELLDSSARGIDPAGAMLLITPKGAAIEKLREHITEPPFLENLGHGTFRVLDLARGTPHLELSPGEVLPFDLEYLPTRQTGGYAVRATQYSLDGGSRRIIGGQSFVAGEVEGFTRRRRWRQCSPWVWWALSAAALLLIFELGKRKRD